MWKLVKLWNKSFGESNKVLTRDEQKLLSQGEGLGQSVMAQSDPILCLSPGLLGSLEIEKDWMTGFILKIVLNWRILLSHVLKYLIF